MCWFIGEQENQILLVEEGVVGAVIMLGRCENDEIHQDCARCLANLCRSVACDRLNGQSLFV